ncbi:MAG: response regulator transcription factor [Candidatus Promineifilaceae bacterium]|nr:response regulator transcription factor [Candidatus Promineifilaceae bacterium]
MTKQKTILLVEGARAGDGSLSLAISKAQFKVVTGNTGRQAIALAQENSPDLAVFDASSLRSNGARTCKRLRGVMGDRPIVHCRAKGQPEEPEIPADVFLEHPFTGRKLLNRIKDLLPADPLKEEVVRFGHLLIFRSKRAVEIKGKGECRLTPKLSQLLEEFLRHPNELISRKQLMLHVWKTDYIGDTRTLDVHIRWVRECIEEDPSNPELLRTVRGKGFVLSIPASYMEDMDQ